MRIYIGADHRGFELKAKLIPWLKNQGYDVVDCGNMNYDPNDDYPDFSFSVADHVASEIGSVGIVICGSGSGVCIAANKVKGIRCGLAANDDMVRHQRTHDNANMMAISADYIDEAHVKSMITIFLTTEFMKLDRFIRRLKKISDREG